MDGSGESIPLGCEEDSEYNSRNAVIFRSFSFLVCKDLFFSES